MIRASASQRVCGSSSVAGADFRTRTPSGPSTAHALPRYGYFQALNARTGDLLWKTNLGG